MRGQIAWLIPQEGVNYGLYYKGLNVLARRDGIVIQPSLNGDESGWNNSNEQPDRAEAEAGVRSSPGTLCSYGKMRSSSNPRRNRKRLIPLTAKDKYRH